MTRKIEIAMNNAILHGKNWCSGNTSVENVNGVSIVKLHHNKIAEIGEDWIRLFDGGGWRTNTTKSRLSAILKENGSNDYIFQKNFQWYIETNGEIKEFENGILLK